jgi:N6-L-threonylcarbamoyladenine synthase
MPLFFSWKIICCISGVVPELASRDHIQRVLPLIKAVLEDGKIKLTDISAIAYTAGPGLAGALLPVSSHELSMPNVIKLVTLT